MLHDVPGSSQPVFKAPTPRHTHVNKGQELYLIVLYAVLDVDEAHHLQLLGKLGGPVPDHL